MYVHMYVVYTICMYACSIYEPINVCHYIMSAVPTAGDHREEWSAAQCRRQLLPPAAPLLHCCRHEGWPAISLHSKTKDYIATPASVLGHERIHSWWRLCSDTVGWATGRASSLQKTECWSSDGGK